MPNQIDSVIIQVRARLQSRQIKLWLDPYYYQEIGVVESELEKLADEFSGSLGISVSNCKLALTELQDGALRKLAARREFDETGLATFSVRRVNNIDGTESVFEIKCALTALGVELQTKIADKLELSDANRIKMISAGKIVNPSLALAAQGIKNNQQFMVIVSAVDSRDAMYDRIKKIKDDVETIVNAGNRHFEMEDQDGNPVFLPPAENKALLMALGFCEKARSAIKRSQFDEALILLLEADEKFTTCNSKFLESVDNYALVNLDIVWCYLCLKNLTQLPDAERRLEICQKSFNRSYGKDLKRLITIKGESCPERALIVRLHLLQGVLLFHQNRRDEAYDKLDTAQSELRDLKVDEGSVLQLMEMGFEPSEARIALRACKGDLNQAANFIHDRKAKVNEARMKSKRERAINANLDQSASDAEGWVNPRSVCTLVEMGFPRKVVIVALKKTENDVPRALDMLQTNMDELIQAVPTEPLCSDEKMLRELKRMGFNEEMAKVALEATLHDDEQSMNSLLKMVGNRTELMNTIQTAVETAGPSTSKGSTIAKKLLKKVKAESMSREAYKRFNEDISANENEYLDLSLNQEEQILTEYKRLLEQ